MQDLDINSGNGTTTENENHYLLEPTNADQPYDFVNFESQSAHSRLPLLPQRQQSHPIMPGSPQAPNDKTSQQMAAWYDTDL